MAKLLCKIFKYFRYLLKDIVKYGGKTKFEKIKTHLEYINYLEMKIDTIIFQIIFGFKSTNIMVNNDV